MVAANAATSDYRSGGSRVVAVRAMPRGDVDNSQSHVPVEQFVASAAEMPQVAAGYGYRRFEDDSAVPDAGMSAVPARSGYARVENLPGDRPVAASVAGVPEVPARDCSPSEFGDFVVSDLSPVSASIEVSQALYGCADEVAVAPAGDHAAIATLVSRGVGGPLLLMGSWFGAALVQEIRRLDPDRVVVAGADASVIRRRLPQVPITELAVDDTAVVAEPASYSRVWLVDDTVQLEALAAVAQQIEVAVMSVSGDLRALAPPARATIAAASEVEMLFDSGEHARWQLDVVRRGDELPGGGLVMFDSAASPGRRLVAAYGHPQTSALADISSGRAGRTGSPRDDHPAGVHRGRLRRGRVGCGADVRGHRHRRVGHRRQRRRLLRRYRPRCDQTLDRNRRSQRRLCGTGPPTRKIRLLVPSQDL